MTITRYSPQERLKMYKQALKDYRTSRHLSYYTWAGFCAYFSNTFHIPKNIYHSLHIIFPELGDMAKLDPSYDHSVVGYGYWFPSGSKAPRIRALQKAIKLLESFK